MNLNSPSEGRASLARSYRNLSEREIRAKLDESLSEAERVTAKAELLRRADSGPDTTLATGFAPTSLFDVESSSEPDPASAESDGGPAARGRASPWPWIAALAVLVLLAFAWTMRARFIHGA
jgi:hypothetical protein